MISATEEEAKVLHHSGIPVIPNRVTLCGLKHTQGSTVLETDNDTAQGFLASTINSKNQKHCDMNHHWMKEKLVNDVFEIYCDIGPNNGSDFYTNTNLPSITTYVA